MRRLRGLIGAAVVCVILAGCVAVADRASRVGAFSAQLNAHGHTDSSPAHYYFQYATAPQALGTGFGFQTPTRGPIPPNVPGGGANLRFAETVSGLTPATRYYFRVCGGDASITPDVCSQTRSFTTRAGVSFNVPGSYSWVVPAGVTRATFDVYGASGGSAAHVEAPGTVVVTGVGGMGAHVHATLSVQAGQTLTIVVGGRGGDATFPSSTGGFNGGAGDPQGDVAGIGGGGGGASDVRTGPPASSALSTRLLVAGGGGGASTLTGTDQRGGDGGLVGTDGQAGGTGAGASQGGGGGGATAGGAGGMGATGPFMQTDGATGTLGFGGVGAVAPPGNEDNAFGAGGGGGAGGLYGGGGGGGGFLVGDAVLPPGAGGGGSSLAAVNTSCQPTISSGVQSGDGLVTITYNSRRC